MSEFTISPGTYRIRVTDIGISSWGWALFYEGQYLFETETEEVFVFEAQGGTYIIEAWGSGSGGYMEFIVEREASSEDCEVSYDMEAIVPIAVSSELSHTGEERIHMAPAIELPPPPPPPEHRLVVGRVYLYPSWGE